MNKKSIQFEKFHGNGNDFIFIASDFLNNFYSVENLREFAKKVCHRYFGIGADGVVFCDVKHHSFLILNSDGSFATTCGNALRCFGLKCLQNNTWNGTSKVEIMRLVSSYISVDKLRNDEKIIANKKDVMATLLSGSLESKNICVAMGVENRVDICPLPENPYGITQAVFVQLANPHLVFLSEVFANFGDDDYKKFGQWAQGELLNLLPEIPVCNISMLNLPPGIKSYSSIGDVASLVVYERGAGLTLCCGSGAVASRSALESLGLVKKEQNKVSFNLPGGCVDISWEFILESPQRTLTGVAEFVYKGQIEWY